MTRYGLTVCLPPTPTDAVRTALDAALRPFDHNLTDDWNPAGEWDFWRVAAGEEWQFTVRPGYETDPRLIRTLGDDPGLPALTCAGGPRGLLDFPATKAAAVARERRRLDVEREDGVTDPGPDPGHALDRAAAEALADTALLTLDGRWRDRDHPGEPPWPTFARQFTAYLEALADDCIVVRLLCHC
jgi:hypothetical protein